MFKKMIYLTYFFLVLCPVLTNVAKASDPNLVGWWKLDETSGTIAADSSGNGNDGTLNGGPVWQPAGGMIGGALQFDGIDDRVPVGSTGRPANTFSFGGWMKTSATHEIDPETTSGADGTNNQRYAFDPQHKGDIDAGAGLSVGTNGISVYEHGSDYMPATAVYSGQIGSDWNHIMVVYSNKRPTIYLNGQAVRTGLSSPRATVYAPIKFGGISYGYFAGLMDDIRIYNRAMSEAEIMELAIPAKWVQLPDMIPNGIDICVDSSDGIIRHLSDDFQCTSSGKITQITLWGSWKDDNVGRIKNIHVEFHPDDPVGTLGSDLSNLYSKPGPEVLWSKDFGPEEFSANLYHQVPAPGEWWQDVAMGELKAGGDTHIWQIDMSIDPNQAFQQTGSQSQPVIYWLHVQVDTEAGRFGWKTRAWPEHFMDDAVWDTGRQLPRFWRELQYQQPHPYSWLGNNSIDMSFMLVSEAVAELPTSQPVAVTACPAVNTTCPTVITECPPVETECPMISTECPPGDTYCPVVYTKCPAPETTCTAVSTQCPPVTTDCPVLDTECPTNPTVCTSVSTYCPVLPTQCQPTQCPFQVTSCPEHNTMCPPMKETECPVEDTRCPPEFTRCIGRTSCPIITYCPAIDTECPPVDTQCPVPANFTRCNPPPPGTFCQVGESTSNSMGGKRISYLAGLCPVIDAPCPSISSMLAAAKTR